MITATDFIILTLMTWRISSLFANEDGPYFIFKRIRNRIDSMKSQRSTNWNFDEGLRCEWCNSIWFGTAVSVLYVLTFKHDLKLLFVLPLALSAGVIVMKYLCECLIVKSKEPK